MAVIRIEKTRNYTTMCNHHLRNQALSLKAKGLLSIMLSLPDNWNYTTKGLAKLSRDGAESIAAALKELEGAGYVVRNRLRDSKGRITDTEYVIYEKPLREQDETKGGGEARKDASGRRDAQGGAREQGEPEPPAGLPHTDCPHLDSPHPGNPDMDNPDTGEPEPENPAQLSTNPINTQSPNTKRSNIHPSIPNPSAGAKGCDAMDMKTIRRTRFDVEYQIDYDEIVTAENEADLRAIVELMTETLCSSCPTIRVAGSAYPAEFVKQRLRQVDYRYIEYVLNGLKSTRSEIRNMKQYLLTTLFNAPSVMHSHHEAMMRREGLYEGE